MYKFNKIIKLAIITMISGSILTACSHAIKTGAEVGIHFTEKHIAPPILAMNDVDMVCNSSTALVPLIMSMKAMKADPAKLAVLLYSSSGVCAESKAVNAELRSIRAAKAGQNSEALDAKIEQKRWSAIAARRQYQGYQLFEQHWKAKYKYTLDESCPKMKKDFEQTVYLLGLLSGLQAMTNDINSGGQVHVPKNIAAEVERSISCLDNTKYWGVPDATRALIWTLLPGAGAGKADPFQTMKQSMKLGEKKGMRLSHALYAIAAQANGDDKLMRDALRSFAASRATGNVDNVNYMLIDRIASEMVQNIADRYWTENTGSRAPEDGMRLFWNEHAMITDDSLFNTEKTSQ